MARLVSSWASVAALVWLASLSVLGGSACDGGCDGSSRSVDAVARSRVEPVRPPSPGQGLSALPRRMAASHILIAHNKADSRPPGVTRSEEDARRIAERLVQMLRRDPTRFEELARSQSDGPRGAEGGYLGTWNRGRMLFSFEAAVAVLPVGRVSAPVKTVFGYHIIRREPVLPAERVSASHLLVSHADAVRAPPTVTRSRDQARQKAERLAAAIDDNPDLLAELIRKQSDGPRAATGGQVGVWVTTTGQRPPLFDRAVLALPVGGISPEPVESSFGFHIFERTALPTTVPLAASQILISHRRVIPAALANPRTLAQARAMARKLWTRLQQAPDTFEEGARHHSEHDSADRGGRLGVLPAGQIHPAVQRALMAIKPGQITRPVETPRGVLILRRDPVAPR